MPEETVVPSTANAEATPAPAAETATEQNGATADPSTAAKEPNADTANTENPGAAPAEEPRVKLSELTAQRKRRQEAEQRAQEAERKAAFLEGQLSAGKPVTAANTEDKPPVLDDFDGPDAFERWDQARIDYGVQQSLKKQQAESVRQQTAENAKKTFSERFRKAATEIPDLQETVAEYRSNFSPRFVEAVSANEMGPQIIYYFAKNEAEAKRFEKMTVEQALFELGAMKSKVQEFLQPKTKKVTQASPPINPGNGSSSNVDVDLADLPMSEYARKREEQVFIRVNGRLIRRA